MDASDDFYDKELNLNCFYMHAIFEQKYHKPAIVITKNRTYFNLLLKKTEFVLYNMKINPKVQ
jgi:hypothetical protein